MKNLKIQLTLILLLLHVQALANEENKKEAQASRLMTPVEVILTVAGLILMFKVFGASKKKVKSQKSIKSAQEAPKVQVVAGVKNAISTPHGQDVILKCKVLRNEHKDQIVLVVSEMYEAK
ncbi:hypothetical protein AAG747_11630 [Rapidithrix thailandica]|uniref:Uncharacterized protein n=1 Tax=Rapidithrix thailandica TaxID=413964 RepID=A0AAW9S7X9_9BACT